MIEFFFNDIFATMTTVLAVTLLAASYKLHTTPNFPRWGLAILVFILLGTFVSMTAAMRDAYATENAMFAMTSLQSNLCSIAGMLIFLSGVVAVFLRRQRKTIFTVISVLFLFQVLVIEGSRFLTMIGR